MQGRTHMFGGALAAGLATSGFCAGMTGSDFVVALLIGAAAGLLPDIDKSGTTASKWLPVVAWLKNRRLLALDLAVLVAVWLARIRLDHVLFDKWFLAAASLAVAHFCAHLSVRTVLRHRGVTHSLWAVCALLLGLRCGWPLQPSWVWIAATAGYSSHLILDGLTPLGIDLLPPIRWRFSMTGWLPEWLQAPFVTGQVIERRVFRPAVLMGLLMVLLGRYAPGWWSALVPLLRHGILA